MGPQASEEWESFSGMGGTGGAGSVDGFSITDASGEFVGGIEFEDDVLLAMRLQQVRRTNNYVQLLIGALLT